MKNKNTALFSGGKTKTRKQAIKRIKKELDKLAKYIAKKRDGWKCIVCGATDSLHSHHVFFHKGHSQALAYDPRNLATLCFVDHIIRIHRRGDGAFISVVLEKMTEIVGSDAVEEMKDIARNPKPLSLEDYELMLDNLQKFGRI
jgi:hypothetical protein